MTESLLPYVSVRLATTLAARPSELTAPEEIERSALVLFADISGFSALTERLAKQEGSSPDRIGEILSSALGSVVDAVTDHGGDVMTFAGDAVLATWPADDLRANAAKILSAVATANDNLRLVDSGSDDPLRLRTGIASGLVREALLGGVNGEWHHLTAGEAVFAATRAASSAEPGELVATAAIGELMGSRSTNRSGLALIDYSNPPVVDQSRSPARNEAAPVEPFVPAVVREAVGSGSTDWIAELRRITMAFVRLDSFGADIDLGALDGAVRTAQSTVNEYGGSVARVLYDDKGLIFVLRWAGFHASRDIAVRALQAAMELREKIPHTSIGIATGTAFIGQLGSQRRMDYTTIGHAVNRAARLMQTAHDEVLCDGGVRSAASSHLTFVGRGVMPLKGFQEPVAFYRPLAMRQDNAPRATPLVAREREFRTITGALGRVHTHDEASVIVVSGEAGIGKSRLIEAALDRIRDQGLRTMRLAANQMTRSSPYAAWRPVMRSLMGLSPSAASADIESRAAQLLDPSRHRLIPLLLSALGADNSGGVEEGDGDNTRDVLSALYRTLTGEGATVLVLEDAQWMDSSSVLLADHLFRLSPATAVLLVARPAVTGSAPWSEIIHSPGVTIELGPLADTESVAIASQLLDVDFIPPALADIITEKAAGHPLFTEELVQSLRDQGVVRVISGDRRVEVDRSALRLFSAPATLQDTVANRLDQLQVDQLLTLKVASVLGPTFDLDALVGIHPTSTEPRYVSEHLDGLDAVDLVRQTADGFAFKHAILRDVAYSLITDRQRRQLHGEAARWYDNLEGATDWFVLAEHWRQAEVLDKAAVAFERAGDLSLRTGSFHEAVNIFSDMHAMTPPNSSSLDRARWKRKEAISHRGLGDLARTHELLVDALSELDTELPNGFGLATGITRQAIVQLTHRLKPGKLEARDTRTRAVRLEKAEIFFALGTTTFSNLDALSLFYAGLSALNAAEKAPGSGVLALSQSFLMYVSGVLGLRRTSARYQERAEAASVEIADPSIRAEVLYNRAGFLGTIGRWSQAEALNLEALELYETRGNHRGVRTVISLLGYHAHVRGRITEEEEIYDRLEVLAEKFDDGLSALFADAWRAEVALRRGRPVTALRFTEALLDSPAAQGDRGAKLKVLGVRALALLRSDADEDARLVAEEALELIRSAQAFTAPYAYDGYVLAARFWLEYERRDPNDAAIEEALKDISRALRNLRRGLGIARAAGHWIDGHDARRHGRKRSAIRSFNRGLEAAEAMELPFEEALLRIGRAEVLPSDRRAAELQEALDLVTSTGCLHLREEVLHSLRPS